MVDGLKISLRKILYSAFKRKLTSEIKVAQFSGYVSEHSGYHHGEMSLNKAIVGLAQNYVGANNINTIEKSLEIGEEVDQSTVENQLFKGENVRTKGSDSPRTASKKMREYYENLNKEENGEEDGEEDGEKNED
mgnify:CR=1 FL=1